METLALVIGLCFGYWLKNHIRELDMQDKKEKRIDEIYEKFKKRFAYPDIKTEEIDLYILKNCLNDDFVEQWIKDMTIHPPAYYPLDMFYEPKIGKWVSFYIHTGRGRVDIGNCARFIKDRESYEYIKEHLVSPLEDSIRSRGWWK